MVDKVYVAEETHCIEIVPFSGVTNSELDTTMVKVEDDASRVG